jgi:DNA polymerase-3 subunit epsilon
VAHNAPFDIGFLKAACAETGVAWPPAASVDTAVLARRLLSRDEVPNCKLATLAPFFRAGTEPCHRALADARATVDVLHGLFERLGPLGITTLEELTGLTRQVDPERRRKRHLADGVPGARASTSSAGRATSRSTSGRRPTCAAGCAATSPPASSAAG